MRIERELFLLVEPVTTVDGMMSCLTDLGLVMPSLADVLPDELVAIVDQAQGAFDSLVSILQTIEEQGDAVDVGLVVDVITLAQEIFGFVQGVRAHADPDLTLDLPEPYGDPAFWATLGRRLPGYLLERWVRDYHPAAHAILDGLSLWTARPDTGLDLLRLSQYVTAPGPNLSALLLDPEGQVDLSQVVSVILRLSDVLGLSRPAQALIYEDGVTIPDPDAEPRAGLLAARFLPPGLADVAQIDAGFDFDGRAAALSLEVSGGAEVNFQLSPDWVIDAGVEGAAGLSLSYAPGEDITLDTDAPSASGNLGLTGAAEGGWKLLGFGGASGVYLGQVDLAAEAALQGSQPELILRAGFQDLQLRVDLSESDGFIAEAMPLEGFELSFAAGLTWSSETGLSLTSEGPADIQIPVNLTLGPISVPTLRLALTPQDAAVDLALTVTASADIGFLQASVENIGLTARLSEDPGGAGLFGDTALTAGFHPPTGLGLAVGTPGGPISGGGYLNVIRSEGRYEGIVDLQIVKVGVAAVVLIDTQALGTGAWSMFFALFIRLPSIQLGFGISLEGVGGVAGIHRSLEPEALLEAVRSGNLGTILFPENPIADAPVIIDTFRSIFPPAQGRYVFGPVVKLAWAKGTVSAELGVVIELPDPILVAVLGSISIVLPNLPVTAAEDAPEVPDTGEGGFEPAIVALHLDMAGIFDFEAGTVAVDAYLYDSAIAGFPIGGGMSMRAGFKGTPYFLLALGGFHPGFPQPEGFPQVPRLSMAIQIASVIDISFEAYFAVASNTVQFGAAIHLAADVEIFSIEGGFSFDALFAFDPLHVQIALDMYVSVRALDMELLAVRMSGTADGPKPWVVTALAEVNVIGYREGVEINRRTGPPVEEPALEPPGVLNLLVDALSAEDALETSHKAPRGVVLAEMDETAEVRPVSPDAEITIAQTVAPLDTDIDRFGTNENLEHTNIGLVLAVGDGAQVTQVTDWFAPGRYRDLGATDAARLAAPSFEQMPAGHKITGGVTAGTARGVDLGHKVVTVDPAYTRDDPDAPPVNVLALDGLLGLGDIRQAPTSGAVLREAVADVTPVTMRKPRFVAVDGRSGAQLSGGAGSYMDKQAQGGGGADKVLIRSFEAEVL